MKLTNKQKIDLETIVYFIPEWMKKINITDDDIIKFFEYSDKWMHKEYVKSIPTQWEYSWFWALLEWKRWRWIHIKMYQEWVLDGSMPYYVLLGWNDKERKYKCFWKLIYKFLKIDRRFIHNPIPRSVVDFLKKEMFQWQSSESIENAYRLINMK